MRKKKFYSLLFRRDILINENDYWAISHAELLFRIAELEKNGCDCTQCQKEFYEYKNALKKVISLRTETKK